VLLYVLTGQDWRDSYNRRTPTTSSTPLALLTLWQQLLTLEPHQFIALYMEYTTEEEDSKVEQRLTLLAKNEDVVDVCIDICTQFGEQGIQSVPWSDVEEWLNVWTGNTFHPLLTTLFFNVQEPTTGWKKTTDLFSKVYTYKTDNHTNLRLAHFHALCHQYQFQSAPARLQRK